MGNNLLRRVRRRLNTIKWKLDVSMHPGNGKTDSEQLVLFDTSIDSQNMGDVIIRYYCDRALAELSRQKKVTRVPTHTMPSIEQLEEVSRAGTKIVCGTNLITPHYEEFSNWKMPHNLRGYRDVVTLGVGWGYYCETTSKISKFVYRTILSKDKLHSVRNGYTEQKFREMGITNVVNTGCPTLWGLTPEHCASIPIKKARRVITTLTDYNQNPEDDRRMIEILRENYDEVYVWLQGTEDEAYLESLVEPGNVQVIERNLDAYTRALGMGDVDYVGTRLHAGIHAMNMGVRTIILAVDNRAVEMGKDFHLPVIQRNEIKHSLQRLICSEWKTRVELPSEQINAWRQQFA